ANMPDAELRRQRKAFYRGLLRATTVGLVIISFMIYLIVDTRKQRSRAEEQEAVSRRLLYITRMNLAFQHWEIADIRSVQELLDRYMAKPGQEDLRGFEWYYLWQLCHSSSNLFTFQHSDA